MQNQATSPRAPSRRSARADMNPIAAADFGSEQARHLLWRAGFGGTPEQIRTLVEWGPERAVDHLLEYGSIDFDAVTPDLFDDDIMRPRTPQERAQVAAARRAQDEETLARFRRQRQEAQREDRRQLRQMQRWWLKRMIETPRPLEEKMTLFWHGHFATAYRPVENSYHMFLQNKFFRNNAVGSFADLLYGIIRDPAMLAYLDQNTSRRQNPNENLARELMELFSLGLGNYTEQDIKEGARALTGYTFENNDFIFRQQQHDPNPKRILGRSGTLRGEDFVAAILEQRACSVFMSRKIYDYFVADIPDLAAPERDLPADVRAAVADLAFIMRQRRYQLKPVLRRLFLSRHFYEPRIAGQQIKSPVMLVVGAIRSLGVPARDLNILLDAMDLMGQNLFNPPSVRGWQGGRPWINTSTLFVRQNTLAFLLTGRQPAGRRRGADRLRFDPSPLAGALADSKDVDRTVTELLGFALGRVPADAKHILMNYASGHARVNRETLLGVLLLISAMPEYQLC